MGTAGNGDARSDNDGPPGGLPGLPPEWGTIIVPDDASALATDAARLRTELRRQARRTAWRRRLGLATGPDSGNPRPVRLALLIISVAVLVTLTSFIAAIRPSRQDSEAAPAGDSGNPGRQLPALDLIGEEGAPVPLRGLLPALIVFTDDCVCTTELNLVSRIVPPGVTVVALTSDRSAQPERPPQSPAAGTRFLTDPATGLRTFLRLSPAPASVPVLLAARSGTVVRVLPAVGDLADHPAELAHLGDR
ncbi:hypothetical protein GCM10027280_34000 [Micromonospora polyrhachis]|uniref:Uncharacterized protein n=1 Tax=Micromonospora polyrhachis TaxID=1282883 RepID=A0A7W7SRB9_9ACTN|nr:hypothetical protein [Micromonospora polyrhachis]MBB4959528.1 hypothetical protein [Micromonospora polyrhachis]